MFKTRRYSVISNIGIIIFIFTLFSFFLAVKNIQAIDILSLLFISGAEIIFFGGLIYIENISGKTYQGILRSGGYSVLGLYAFANIVVSILFMAFLRKSIALFFILQLALISILLILMILIISSSKSIYEKNSITLNSVSMLEKLTKEISYIRDCNKNSELSPKLDKLFDSIYYSDNSKSDDSEAMIANKLSELKEAFTNEKDNIDKINHLIEQIQALIIKRNLNIKQFSSGNI